MAEDISGKKAALQAFAAVAVLGAIAGALWLQTRFDDQGTAHSGPAVCSSSHEKVLRGQVSGGDLCKALNRPDLPTLLGAPGSEVESASGSASESAIGGIKTVTPEATVDIEEYTVKLSATYDRLGVSDFADLVGASAQKKTVLGHPAVLYMDRTISIRFNLGGGSDKAETGAGGVAWCLLIAKDVKDGGGYYEIDIYRQDNVTPDHTTLIGLAERVLPAVPGWAA
ncbi:DUF6215 domain-containing protein [Streptomyces sp. NPDC050738]|uniref:DUF6215 domain-containing protein n=1 Tax=Streptomyces sp. NPDC050738 TaxID=3154744 RepID=UPI00341AF69E